jgi:hypothetical protein
LKADNFSLLEKMIKPPRQQGVKRPLPPKPHPAAAPSFTAPAKTPTLEGAMPRKKSKVNAVTEMTEVATVTNNVTEQFEHMTSAMLDLSNLRRHQHIMKYGDMSLPSAKVNALDAESTFSFNPNEYVDPEVLEFNAALQAKKQHQMIHLTLKRRHS